MFVQKKTINNVPQIIHLTADTGAGLPVGTIIGMYKKSNPQGYKYLDGSQYDTTAYPALYQYLGTDRLPDYREFALVGAEQNTTSSVIATHDVFTQGEEKDDQLQDHSHRYFVGGKFGSTAGIAVLSTTSQGEDSIGQTGRHGTVTRGKRKAVYWYIKATSGLTENQQENVLNAINENLSYSTTEHKIGKKWIDGKDIWSKTVIFGALPNTAQKAVAHNIANVSKITKQEGYFTNEITFFPLPYVDNGNTRVQMFTDKTNIQITTYTDLSTFSATVTLEYTKTTDN